MGIKDLKILIKKNCPESIKQINLSELSNKKIAIDTSIYLYKFKYGNCNLLLNFIRQIFKFQEHNIIPIYVFDGKPPTEKKSVIDSRKEIKRKKYERKEEIEKKLEEYKDIKKDTSEKVSVYEENTKILKDELKKLNLSIISINKEDIDSLKELFDVLNINYINAETEAEIICARLCKNNLVDACLSDDTDVLPNGSNIFITGYNYKNDYLIKYDYYKILEELKLNEKEFIDLCILCGCDYTIKINKIGPITAYKLILKYKTIENVLKNISSIEKYSINEQFINDFKYQECRDIFLKEYSELLSNTFKYKKYDKNIFKEFLTKYSINYTIK